MSEDGTTWETSDLGTAAYVHMRGLAILGVRRTHSSGNFVFMFQDPKEQGEGLKVEYLNSESRKFDAAVRSLKKLCYDNGSKQHANRRARGWPRT